MMLSVDIRRRIGGRDIAAQFEAGAGVTALFGPSGAGKTSILDMIAGLARPDAGRIVRDGEVLFDAAAGIDVTPERRRIGYVFQDRRLFPHLRVRDNLRFADRAADVNATVALLGIAHLLDRWPRHLSGGEAQRVAIGRALLSNPALLLLDEPLSHLDRARADEVLSAIERLRDATALPILYVTHDRAELARLGATLVEIA
jgi:molybdate transport system ATP-binding protein